MKDVHPFFGCTSFSFLQISTVRSIEINNCCFMVADALFVWRWSHVITIEMTEHFMVFTGRRHGKAFKHKVTTL